MFVNHCRPTATTITAAAAISQVVQNERLRILLNKFARTRHFSCSHSARRSVAPSKKLGQIFCNIPSQKRTISTSRLGHYSRAKILTHFNQPNIILLKEVSYQTTRPMSQAVQQSDDVSSFAYTKSLLQKYKPREVTFKTPYGQIAGQEWGNPNASNKFICIHGWLDNCGTFEPLIPHLLNHKNNSETFHLVAFDGSGVGLSCHRPLGSDYNQLSQIMEIRRIVQALKWNSYSIIGHSMGSHLSFMYCSMFADEVKQFISIDLAFPITRAAQYWNHSLASSIKTTLLYESQGDDDPTTNMKVAIYSREEALQRLIESHGNSLTKESAEVLLSRGARKESWGYIFNRDIRLRTRSIEFWPDDEFMLRLLKGTFKTNCLIILGKNSLYAKAIPQEKIKMLFNMYSEQCKIFKSVSMAGTHHLHMNNPDRVASAIVDFLDEVEATSHSNTNGSQPQFDSKL